MTFQIALGDRQFPVADLTIVEVEAQDHDDARKKALTGRSWAFVMSCVETDKDK